MKNEKQSAMIVLKAVQKEATPLMRKVSNLSIKSKKDYDAAGHLVKQLKELRAHAEAKKRTILDPLNEAAKATRELFKPFEESVSLIESDTKAKMISWSDKQDTKREVLEERFEQGSIGVVALANKLQDVRTASEFAETRKQKEIVIEDESKIPREYMVPDMRKIKEALKTGKKIPGVKEQYKKVIAI